MKLKLYLTYENRNKIDINQDLILRAKNSNIIDCFFLDEDDIAVNVTGAEIYFMVKDTPSTVDASAKLNKKITSLTDPTNGEVEIELTSTDTSDLLGSYIYQIKVKYDSKWYTVAEGNVTFQQNIITRES